MSNAETGSFGVLAASSGVQFRAPFVILVAVFLCGCSSEHFEVGRGDVGRFILQQAIIRGGSPVNTNGLPAIGAQWRYSTDKYGVVIQIPQRQYPSVEEFLHQAFGKPGFGPEVTANGGRLGEYRLTPKGGGIQFGCDTNETWVIVTRPMTQQEWDTEVMQKALPNALKAMRESR